jgi:hypothetical protein
MREMTPFKNFVQRMSIKIFFLPDQPKRCTAIHLHIIDAGN